MNHKFNTSACPPLSHCAVPTACTCQGWDPTVRRVVVGDWGGVWSDHHPGCGLLASRQAVATSRGEWVWLLPGAAGDSQFGLLGVLDNVISDDDVKKTTNAIAREAGSIASSLGLNVVADGLQTFLVSVWKWKPIQDFIHSDEGMTFLRACAIYWTAGLASVGSAAVATTSVAGFGLVPPTMVTAAQSIVIITSEMASLAIPGMVQGKPLVQAITEEGIWRVNYTLNWIGAHIEMPESAKNPIKQLADQIPGGIEEKARKLYDSLGIKDAVGEVSNRLHYDIQSGVTNVFQSTGRDLALKYGLSREDVALQLKAYFTGRAADFQDWKQYIHAEDYDPWTGCRDSSPMSESYSPVREALGLSVGTMASQFDASVAIDPSKVRARAIAGAVTPAMLRAAEGTVLAKKTTGESGGVALPLVAAGVGVGGAVLLGATMAIAAPVGIVLGLATWAARR